MPIVPLLKTLVVAPSGRAQSLLDALYSFNDFHIEGREEGEKHALVAQLYSRARSLSLESEAIVRQLNLSAEQGIIDVILRGESLERREITVEGVEALLKRLEEEAREIIPAIKGVLEELKQIESQIEGKEALVSTLSTVAPAGLDFSALRDLRRFYAAGFTASTRDVAELRRGLGDVAYVEDLPVGHNLSFVLIVGKKEAAEKIERITRGFNLRRVELPEELSKDVGKAYEDLKKELEELLAKRGEKKRQVEEMKAKYMVQLLALRDASSILRDTLDRLRGDGLKRTVVIEGYIPRDRKEEFIEKIGREAYIEFSEIGHPHHGHGDGHGSRHQPPTLLKHGGYLESFRPITELQGTPGYFEVDPTPLVSVFFLVFYGMMFADLGQGLVISALGIILWMRARGLLKTWGKLLVALGGASAIGGFLIQEAFGFNIAGLTGMKPVLEMVEKHAGEVALNSAGVLVAFQVALLLGFLHVSIGMIMGVVKLIKNGEVVEAITSRLASLLMYILGLLFALAFLGAGGFEELTTSTNPAPLLGIPSGLLGSIALPGLIAMIFVLMLGKLIAGYIGLGPRMGAIASIGGGLLEVLENIIHFMSNTLSYLRLAILLLIHIALMLLVNATWENLGAPAIPILIIGNIGVIGLEGIIVFIQALRLHVYEFFTKFFEGTGSPFHPMRINSRFVQVFLGVPNMRR